jgi:hypothetical protein
VTWEKAGAEELARLLRSGGWPWRALAEGLGERLRTHTEGRPCRDHRDGPADGCPACEDAVMVRVFDLAWTLARTQHEQVDEG